MIGRRCPTGWLVRYHQVQDGMADSRMYERLLTEASALKPADQRRLIEALASLVSGVSNGESHHSVRELRGLGKHVWRGVDAQRYVDQERSMWDG